MAEIEYKINYSDKAFAFYKKINATANSNTTKLMLHIYKQ